MPQDKVTALKWDVPISKETFQRDREKAKRLH